MASIIDCLVAAAIGVVFTVLGGLKLYGLWKQVEGGADKPFFRQVCGT